MDEDDLTTSNSPPEQTQPSPARRQKKKKTEAYKAVLKQKQPQPLLDLTFSSHLEQQSWVQDRLKKLRQLR